MARTPIGQILKEQGRIDEYQLASALAHQRRWGGRIESHPRKARAEGRLVDANYFQRASRGSKI